MDISGSYTFNAQRDRVWDLLMNPDVIASCIPGCDRFEPDGEDRYKLTLTVGLAAITGTYEGTVVLTDKIPHTSYRLVVEGQGRPGFVKGNSAIVLRAIGLALMIEGVAYWINSLALCLWLLVMGCSPNQRVTIDGNPRVQRERLR